jgi:hypothetical protein
MAPSILSYVDHDVAVLAGSQPCTSRPGTAKAADTHVLVAMAWSCPPDGELRYRVTMFQDVDPAARHLALISTESGERELALDNYEQGLRRVSPDATPALEHTFNEDERAACTGSRRAARQLLVATSLFLPPTALRTRSISIFSPFRKASGKTR